MQALVVDFGGVLTTPVRNSLAAWLAADRVVADSFTAVLREWLGRNAAAGSPIHQLETGELTGPEFERQLARRLRTPDGRPVPAASLLDRMFARIAPDPAMLDVLREVRQTGCERHCCPTAGRTGTRWRSWPNCATSS